MAEERKRKKTAARKPAAKRSASKAPTSGTAPSSANLDKLERFEPSEEAKQHEPSDVDAMGQDKRRAVVGHSYGPTRRSQIIFFVLVGAVAVLLIGGSFAAIKAFDQPEDSYADKAPWAQAGSENNAAPNSPSGPCGEPGNPPEAPAGSACAAERTSDMGPALPGEVPPGGDDKAVTNQESGAGGAGTSSGSTASAQ
jgi:hypothetical protein